MATKKTTKSKAKKSTAKRAPAKKNKAQKQAEKRLYAILLFALGILIFMLAVVKGDRAWLSIHNAFLGMFSWCAYLIGPIIAYTAVMIDLDKTDYPIAAKLISMSVLILLFCGASQIFSKNLPEGSIVDLFRTLYMNGKMLHGGGVAGLIFGIPLLLWLDFTGAAIIICLLIFVTLMILSGGTIWGFITGVTKPVKHIEEAYATARENKIREDRFPPAPVPTGEFKVKNPPVEVPEHVITTPELKKKKNRFLNIINFDGEADIPAKEPAPQAEQTVSRSGKTMYDIEVDRFGETIPENKPKADLPLSSPKDLTPPVMPPKDPIIPKTEVAAEPAVKAEKVEAPKAENHSESKDSIDDLIFKAVRTQPVAPKEPTIISDNGKLNFGNHTMHNQVVNEAQEQQKPAVDIPAAETSPEITEKREYIFPPVELLHEAQNLPKGDTTKELRLNAEKLVDTLKSFGVSTRIVDISRGPAVTRYELQPAVGVKISKITNLADDIALNLAAGEVRIEAPIPNKAAIGIEVPNKVISTVPIREILETDQFKNAKSKLSVVLGKDITGAGSIADLSKMPHVLIAGATGSGKSVCINSLIVSLLYKSTPDEVKLLMIDPKVVELGSYNGIPHLLSPVVTDPKKAAGALCSMVGEMLRRYKLFADNGVRDLKGFNRLCESRPELNLTPMAQIVIIIDELADLMMASPKEVEDYICRLAQMARAAGMHLVIATQRPSVDVITGIIKANIPSRISFAVSSQIDSRTILDMGGAEKLLGRGDMLFAPVGSTKPTRIQGCFVTDKEVEDIVEFIKENSSSQYDTKLMEEIDENAAKVGQPKGSKSASSDSGKSDGDDRDELYFKAMQTVVEAGQASTSLLQRRLKVGYARAARLIDELEQGGAVGPFEGSKPRQVLISKEELYAMQLSEERNEDN